MTAPALQVKPAKYIGIGARSVAQPAGGNNWYRLLFYNIGWNKGSKKKRNTQEHLATEICAMVHSKRADAVGISELFNLKDEHESERRQEIMQHVVAELNASAHRLRLV